MQLHATSMKYTLHPGILTAYWLGLLAICHNTPYPNILQELPPPLRTAAHHQECLGWNQLYHGRLTRYWASAIDHLNPNLALPGKQILIKLTQVTWTYILATWMLRNQHLHQDAGHTSIPNYQQVVHTLYEQKDQIPIAAQDAFFRRPLSEMLELPPSILSPWIVRAHSYMTQQSKAAQKQA